MRLFSLLIPVLALGLAGVTTSAADSSHSC
jgi:hypothetical protein